MFVPPAFAQDGGGAAGGDPFTMFLPLILIVVVFYFLLIRPQQKRMKAHREMVANLRRGDRVVTGGGIIGTVTKVAGDTEVMVEIADNVRVRVARSTITEVLSKTEPARAETEDDDADEEEDEDEGGTGAAKTKPARRRRRSS